jgi:tetratricopeptide (TPR) repeat protein
MSDARFAQALAAARAGRLPQALALVEQELRETPGEPDSLALKAALLNALGRPAEALPVFEAALAANPRNASAHSNQGNALATLGRRKEAVESYGRALAVEPDNLPALCNRAGQLIELQRFEPALADLDRALTLNPDLAAVHRQHSLALMALGRLEQALAAIDKAVALDAVNPRSHERRAAILKALGRGGASEAAAARAAALDPDRADALNRRGLGRLRQGDWTAGWIDHEHRWKSPRFLANSTDYASHPLRQRIDLDVPAQALAGKRVLLVNEQGFGDQIMFLSMVPDLLAAGATVACLCEPRLLALARQSFPAVEFVRAFRGEAEIDLDRFDHVVPLGSLGRLFRDRVEDFPGAPYLAPRPGVTASWRERLGPPRRRLRVGICWRGGADQTNGGRRSMDLATLGPLLRRDDCEFVSLQHGDVAAQLAATDQALPLPIQAFPTRDLADLEQMAGLISALDLVVSVQTTAIHLAGALGQACFVMVPAVAEWRYGERGDRMPWYGSVRLFRQARPDHWGGVIAEVGVQLDRFQPAP